MTLPMPAKEVLDIIRKGMVIPASPLALNGDKELDIRFQKALYKYYAAAGAGGIAVGVHTTQFEIRDPDINLFEPLLKIASSTIDELMQKHKRTIVKVSGICGRTEQAVEEAETAAALGYDLGLLSLGALKDASADQLIEHCREVSRHIPLIGFYLQPSAGGRELPFDFWRKFVEIENVIAVKIAPFNRYKTIEVVRAVALAGREKDITLYTGNDDNIIPDLLTPFRINTDHEEKVLRIKGGLLGQWSVWTKTAVDLLNEIHEVIESENDIPSGLMEKGASLTDANAVVFDAANNFSGCIPGINEVLRRQGLLQYSHCLDSSLCLSPGQDEELTRINREYPWLIDDNFVKKNINEWLD